MYWDKNEKDLKINKKRSISFQIQSLIIVVDIIRYFPPVMSREKGHSFDWDVR